jgi:hypothetical protein
MQCILLLEGPIGALEFTETRIYSLWSPKRENFGGSTANAEPQAAL